MGLGKWQVLSGVMRTWLRHTNNFTILQSGTHSTRFARPHQPSHPHPHPSYTYTSHAPTYTHNHSPAPVRPEWRDTLASRWAQHWPGRLPRAACAVRATGRVRARRGRVRMRGRGVGGGGWRGRALRTAGKGGIGGVDGLVDGWMGKAWGEGKHMVMVKYHCLGIESST